MAKKKKRINPWVNALSTLFKELGAPGFIMVLGAFTFITWGTVDQKREFIDSYILLKGVDGNPLPFTALVFFLVLLLSLQSIYCLRMQRIRKDENNRLGQEKRKLQEMLLNQSLNTSE